MHWYALGVIAGVLQARLYARAIINGEALWRSGAPLAVADFDAFIPWAMAGGLLGGWIGHALLTGTSFSGLSFYGGLLGVVAALMLFARHRGIPILALGDVTAAAYPLVHFFGWIANMINLALPGRPSDVPWAAWFPSRDLVPRHPSQVYEATLEGLTLLFLLGALIHGGALRRPGLVMGAFGVGYGLLRCFCELFREPQLAATASALTMGTLLSIPLILVGAGLIARACARAPQAT